MLELVAWIALTKRFAASSQSAHYAHAHAHLAPRPFEHELTDDCCLRHGDAEDEAAEDLRPELTARLAAALVNVEELVRPDNSGDQAEDEARDEYERRNNGENYADDHNEHVLGEHLVDRHPPRIVDGSDASDNLAAVTECVMVAKWREAKEALDDGHDSDQLHAEAEGGLQDYVVAEEAAGLGESVAEELRERNENC